MLAGRGFGRSTRGRPNRYRAGIISSKRSICDRTESSSSSSPVPGYSRLATTTSGEYPEDLEEYFQRDGRWAVALLAALYVLGIVANVALFEIAPLSALNLANAIGIVILGIVAGVRSRAIQATATVLFGLWLSIYFWVFVPGAY